MKLMRGDMGTCRTSDTDAPCAHVSLASWGCDRIRDRARYRQAPGPVRAYPPVHCARTHTARVCSINLIVLTPLTENLPGPTANKPGDTYVYSYSSISASRSRMSYCSVYAMNGKSIEIDNTDAEGRLVLSGKTYAYSSRVHRVDWSIV